MLDGDEIMKLYETPFSVAYYKYIREIEATPIENIPMEVVEQGVMAIKNYLKPNNNGTFQSGSRIR